MDTHTVKISRSIILEEERFVLILTESVTNGEYLFDKTIKMYI